MFFGSAPKESPLLNQILEPEKIETDRKGVLINVVKCPDTSTQYRQNNSKLLDFLLDPRTIEVIFDLVENNEDRSIHKNIMSLYQSSNTSLHRIFAENLDLAEKGIQSLEIDNPHTNGYGAGMISRFLGRAFDLYSVCIHDVFNVSTKIYPIILRNVHRTVVFQNVSDLVNDQLHPGLRMFLWYALLSISPENDRKFLISEHNPAFALHENYVDNIVDLLGDEFSLHRKNILILLKLYFEATKKYRDNSFTCFVIEWINLQDVYNHSFDPMIFDIASEIGPEIRIASKAFYFVDKEKDNTLLIERATFFLSKCVSLCMEEHDYDGPDLIYDINLEEERFEKIIIRNLKILNQGCYLLQATNAIGESVLKYFPESKEKLAIIVSSAWNFYIDYPEKDHLRNNFPFILDLALMLKDQLTINIEGWTDFINNVIVKYWAPEAKENVKSLTKEEILAYRLTLSEEQSAILNKLERKDD